MDSEYSPTGTDQTAISRARAEQRRAVRGTVRAQRERLTSASGTRPAFDHELGLTFARNRISVAYAVPLLILIVAAAAMLWIDAWIVLGWAAVVLATHVLMLVLCRVYTESPAADISIRTWTDRFVVAEMFGGAAWAALFILLPQTPGDVAGLEVFQFATMLIVVSMITSLASAIPSAAAAGTIPITLAVVVIYLTRGGVLFYALAAMACVAQVFFLLLASRLYRATLTMLEFGPKDFLIAELETAKSISDESRRRAEEANLAKSRFLATMSHERGRR